MASVFLANAIGCAAILVIAACKRARHRRGLAAGPMAAGEGL
jgi:hypothetical protein